MRVLDLRQLCVVGVCEDIRVTVCVGERVYHEQQEEKERDIVLSSPFFFPPHHMYIHICMDMS